jgi:uncharacterized protein YjlB
MPIEIASYIFKDDGVIPNNRLPVLIYRKVCDAADNAAWLENCFQSNNWTNNWRDIVLPYDHFHSNTHEVLGVSKGTVSLMTGGQKTGKVLHISAGDVLILPAGVGHFALPGNDNYEMVGGYPDGTTWDMMTGTAEERKIALIHITSIPVPVTDPVFGLQAGIFDYWK